MDVEEIVIYSILLGLGVFPSITFLAGYYLGFSLSVAALISAPISLLVLAGLVYGLIKQTRE